MRHAGKAKQKLGCSPVKARVVLTDVLVDQGQRVADSIRASGAEAMFIQLDVSNPDEWHEVVRHTVQTYNRLDILVNNAGIAQRHGLEGTSVEDWDRIMDINARGVFLGMKYAIPAMLQSGGGSVINISSTSGIVGFPGGTAYHSAKGQSACSRKSLRRSTPGGVFGSIPCILA